MEHNDSTNCGTASYRVCAPTQTNSMLLFSSKISSSSCAAERHRRKEIIISIEYFGLEKCCCLWKVIYHSWFHFFVPTLSLGGIPWPVLIMHLGSISFARNVHLDWSQEETTFSRSFTFMRMLVFSFFESVHRYEFAFARAFICVIALIRIFRCTAPRYTTLGTSALSSRKCLVVACIVSCFPSPQNTMDTFFTTFRNE